MVKKEPPFKPSTDGPHPCLFLGALQTLSMRHTHFPLPVLRSYACPTRMPATVTQGPIQITVRGLLSSVPARLGVPKRTVKPWDYDLGCAVRMVDI